MISTYEGVTFSSHHLVEGRVKSFVHSQGPDWRSIPYPGLVFHGEGSEFSVIRHWQRAARPPGLSHFLGEIQIQHGAAITVLVMRLKFCGGASQ